MSQKHNATAIRVTTAYALILRSILRTIIWHHVLKYVTFKLKLFTHIMTLYENMNKFVLEKLVTVLITLHLTTNMVFYIFTPQTRVRRQLPSILVYKSKCLWMMCTLFYTRTSFTRRLGLISWKIKKILRRSRGWILENFEKIQTEMCVYYIYLRRPRKLRSSPSPENCSMLTYAYRGKITNYWGNCASPPLVHICTHRTYST